jgi:hypothetical protein
MTTFVVLDENIFVVAAGAADERRESMPQREHVCDRREGIRTGNRRSNRGRRSAAKKQDRNPSAGWSPPDNPAELGRREVP